MKFLTFLGDILGIPYPNQDIEALSRPFDALALYRQAEEHTVHIDIRRCI